jgi:hypothetical protein
MSTLESLARRCNNAIPAAPCLASEEIVLYCDVSVNLIQSSIDAVGNVVLLVVPL